MKKVTLKEKLVVFIESKLTSDIFKTTVVEIRKIYKFIDEPYFNHRFVDLDQLQINKIKYNDCIVGKNMHTIKIGEIMKEYNPYIEKIPQRIRDKYEHVRF